MIPSADHKQIFRAAPDLYLVLLPDFTIADASDSYLAATLTKREGIVGKALFEIFPDNPDDKVADGVSKLSASLHTVLKTGKPHQMDIQKYDIRRADGAFEERFWLPLNSPVCGDAGEIKYLLHRAEDVTDQVRLKTEIRERSKKEEELRRKEERHIASLKASEERFMKIFNFSPQATFITAAATGEVRYINRAFEELFLLDRAAAVGKTVVELGITSLMSRREMVSRIKKQGGFLGEFELALKDTLGNEKKLIATTTTINIDDTECFVTAMINISERRKMEEQLLQTNHFLDAILENIPHMVFVKDGRDLRFVRVNRAGAQIIGGEKTAMTGKDSYDLFPRSQAEIFTIHDREAMERNEMVETEALATTASGDRWLNIKKIPVREDNGSSFLISIAEDVTEQRKQQEAILKLNKELEAFCYSVSHDLRAPLRAVTGFARILEEDYSGMLDAEGLRLLATISRNAEKMGALIDDLLTFSRLGKKGLLLAATNMTDLAASVIRDLEKSGRYAAKISMAPLPEIQADHSLMRQVLMNIIGNALKYSSKKPSPEVAITAKADGRHMIFKVADNGAGFDMRYADKLFGVFQRLHGQEEFEGTGVGLAIVQRIIDKHGGKVWAEAREGEGATFYFSVPHKHTAND